MEKKTECEIVQDLLLGYVDGVLNTESKKLVEKHLVECENCQKKLEYMKKDIEENEYNQRKQIDYLKKLRRKSRVKSVFMALGFVLIICFIYYLIKFMKINDIMNKASEYSNKTNYYTEQIMTDDGRASVIKEYHKDGKYKTVTEFYSDNGVEKTFIQYGSEDSNEIITIYQDKKTAIIDNGKNAEIINEANSSNDNSYIDNTKSLFNKLEATFTMSIETDNYDIGKDYYIIKNKFEPNNREETWVDKETGLVLRRITKGGSKTYFPGTDIKKKVNDVVIDYKYDFETVTDEDVKVPDLSEYKIEYDTTMEDLINEADKRISQD